MCVCVRSLIRNLFNFLDCYPRSDDASNILATSSYESIKAHVSYHACFFFRIFSIESHFHTWAASLPKQSSSLSYSRPFFNNIQIVFLLIFFCILFIFKREEKVCLQIFFSYVNSIIIILLIINFSSNILDHLTSSFLFLSRISPWYIFYINFKHFFSAI